MWQGTGSTNKWNLSCYSPLVLEVLFGFRWFVRVGGGSTAAAVTLDTVAAESRKKMADGVTRSPARLCSRDRKNCYYGRLEYDFLLFVPCNLLLSFSPALSMYVCLLRVPSSVQHSSASLSKCVFCSMCSCVICILPHLGIRCFLFAHLVLFFS